MGRRGCEGQCPGLCSTTALRKGFGESKTKLFLRDDIYYLARDLRGNGFNDNSLSDLRKFFFSF